MNNQTPSPIQVNAAISHLSNRKKCDKYALAYIYTAINVPYRYISVDAYTREELLNMVIELIEMPTAFNSLVKLKTFAYLESV